MGMRPRVLLIPGAQSVLKSEMRGQILTSLLDYLHIPQSYQVSSPITHVNFDNPIKMLSDFPPYSSCSFFFLLQLVNNPPGNALSEFCAPKNQVFNVVFLGTQTSLFLFF